jgi:uncharacterized protein
LTVFFTTFIFLVQSVLLRSMPTSQDAQHWIDKLSLRPHPEGGHYRETYRARLTIGRQALPAQFGGDRSASTSAYFLLEGGDFSALHGLRSDEIWHFYAGSTLIVHVIDPQGSGLL